MKTSKSDYSLKNCYKQLVKVIFLKLTQKNKGTNVTNLLSAEVYVTFLELRRTEILIRIRIPRSCCRIMIVTRWSGAIYSKSIWHYKVSWVCSICYRFELWRIFQSRRRCHSWGRWIYSAGLRLLMKRTITQKLMDCRRMDVKWRKIVTIRNVVWWVMGYMNAPWSEDGDGLLSYSY